MNGDDINSSIMQEVMGNIPVAGPGRTGMMGGGGGLVPPTLLEESRVPKFYLDAIVACGANNSTMLPHTALVYNLMVRSGLPRSVLSYVWSAVNRTLPGQLTRPEFFSCLALIALAQKGESLAALSSMSQLPIPTLQAPQAPVQQISAPLVNVTSRPVQSINPPKPVTKTSFIPSALLPKKFQLGSSSNNTTNNSQPDLLGDVLSTPGSSRAGDLISDPIVAEPVCKSSSVEPVSSHPDLVVKEKSELPATSHNLNDIDWSTTNTSQNKDVSSQNASPVKHSEPGPSLKPALHPGQVECIESIVLAISNRFKEYEMLFKDKSIDAVKEVFETEKGDLYLRSLFHASLILSRSKSSLAANSSPYISNVIKDCERVWSSISDLVCKEQKYEESENGAGNIICGICYQTAVSPVDFAGRSYHSDCANLWVNAVRPVLP